ncbi:MAG: hypothetical protein QF437_03880 [Planctomycetota bacterium]|nr:hypothetical protein [Planctomycetota bacterium]MDP7129599.1 hypothetical protein [Planctomycetota bacterium]
MKRLNGWTSGKWESHWPASTGDCVGNLHAARVAGSHTTELFAAFGTEYPGRS